MIRSSIAVAVALAGLSVQNVSLANSKELLPTFSGTYQLYGQRSCLQEMTMYTGTYTFNPDSQTVKEYVYEAAGTDLYSVRSRVDYSVTAKTVTIGGLEWKATFHLNSQGFVRSATLIGVFDNGGNLCPSQFLLIG